MQAEHPSTAKETKISGKAQGIKNWGDQLGHLGKELNGAWWSQCHRRSQMGSYLSGSGVCPPRP